MITERRWSERWRDLDHNPVALTKARLARDWSQRRLAAEVGISHGYVSEMESGNRNANPAMLLRLAKALRCSVGSLEHAQMGRRAA